MPRLASSCPPPRSSSPAAAASSSLLRGAARNALSTNRAVDSLPKSAASEPPLALWALDPLHRAVPSRARCGGGCRGSAQRRLPASYA